MLCKTSRLQLHIKMSMCLSHEINKCCPEHSIISWTVVLLIRGHCCHQAVLRLTTESVMEVSPWKYPMEVSYERIIHYPSVSLLYITDCFEVSLAAGC
jgi:hypothetical protein